MRRRGGAIGKTYAGDDRGAQVHRSWVRHLHGFCLVDDDQNARQIASAKAKRPSKPSGKCSRRPTRVNRPPSFGDLLVFSAVRRFPQRVKCAMLAWRALEQALSASPARDVTTEDADAL